MTLPSVAAIGIVMAESATPCAFSVSRLLSSSAKVSGNPSRPAWRNSAELNIEIRKSFV